MERDEPSRTHRTNGHTRTDEEQQEQFLRKKGRRPRKRLDVALSKQFVPRFWEDADSRIAVVRTTAMRKAGTS